MDLEETARIKLQTVDCNVVQYVLVGPVRT